MKKLKKYFNEKNEIFVSLHLNDNNKLVNEKIISIGNFDECYFNWGDLFDISLKYSLNYKGKIILAHNHINKILYPSEKDLKSMAVLKDMCIMYKMNICDYLIFNEIETRSYKND